MSLCYLNHLSPLSAAISGGSILKDDSQTIVFNNLSPKTLLNVFSSLSFQSYGTRFLTTSKCMESPLSSGGTLPEVSYSQIAKEN